VSGSGSTDNASFTLSSAGVLKNAVVFNYETKSSYSIRVRVTDQGGLSFEDTRLVSVRNVNETPYGLTLSNNTQNENTATGTTIGTFSGLDVDSGETFTYALSGSGNDNASFTLSSAGVLKNAIVFNYEVKNSYSIEVTVTDSGNNTYTDTFTISVLDVNETPTNITLSSSSIDENVPTGTTIGTFSSSDPDSGNTFTYSLVSGTGSSGNSSFYIDGTSLKSNVVFDYETQSSYSIRVRSTDQGGLYVEKILTISITDISVSGTATVTNLNCYNDSSGTIEVTSQSGGDSPYTYSINGISYQTSTSFTGLGAGTYTVYIKDDNGEIGTLSKTITQPPVLSVTDSHTDPTCYGGSDGEIVFSVAGGTGEKTYTINGDVTTDTTHTGLTAGTYTFIATDENGCTDSRSVTLSVTQVSVNFDGSDVSCNGDSDGSIRVFCPTGGSGSGYEVKIGSNAYQNLPTGCGFGDGVNYTALTAGTYTITVKDGDGCEREYTSVITEPTTLSASASGTLPTCSNSSDGTITVTASGGTSPYEYDLANTGYQTSNVFSNLSSGSYTGRVRDNNGCIGAFSVDITRTQVSATVTQTNVTCNGDDDGTITVTSPSGGTGTGYEVKLNSNGTYVNLETETYSNLAPGTYTVYVKDSNDCERTYSITITENAVVTASVTSTDPTCFGDTDGSITVTGSGGTGSYTYSIGSGYQASNTFTNLGNGAYNISVQDSNGCIGTTARILLKQEVSATVTQSNVTCNKGTNGSITVSSPSGGNGVPYSVKLNSGSYTTTFPKTYSSLSAGTNTITVRDTDGCIKEYSITITEPTEVNLTSSSVTHPTCNYSSDGEITVSATGGTGTKEYSINGISYQSSGTFTGLSVGTHTLYARDTNNCVDTLLVTLSKSQVTATVTHTNASCNLADGGGSGTITVSSPTGGNGGTYQSKLNSGSYENIGTSKTYSNVSAGTHTITVKDGSGCTTSYSVTITQPNALSIGRTMANPTCSNSSDGSITWTVAGGTSPYSYTLNGDVTETLSHTGLTTGSYTLEVTDDNGCTKSRLVTLSKSAVTASYSVSNPLCNGESNGSVSITSITGGNGGTYQYQWDGGTWVNFSNTQIIIGQSAGTYTLKVRDTLQCTTTYSVNLGDPSVLNLSLSATHPTCWDGSDGEITVTGTGGTSPYTYRIGSGNYQISNTFTGLSTGPHTITIRDANSCTNTATTTLFKAPPSATFTTTDVSCNGGSDGLINVANPAGGSGSGYNHRLDNGLWVVTFPYNYNTLSAGTYTIDIRDGDSCIKSHSVTVTQPTAGTASILSFVSGSNGSITVTSSGGTWNKTYRLYEDTTSPYTNSGGVLTATITGVTSSNPSQTFSNLSEGYYYVVITDANGCTATSAVQSTFAGSVGDLKISRCGDSVIYYANSQFGCSEGNDLLMPFAFNIGDIVQFAVGTDCPHGTTYCGEITATGQSNESTAILTSEFTQDDCNSPDCNE
jgi:hypothetical protein